MGGWRSGGVERWRSGCLSERVEEWVEEWRGGGGEGLRGEGGELGRCRRVVYLDLNGELHFSAIICTLPPPTRICPPPHTHTTHAHTYTHIHTRTHTHTHTQHTHTHIRTHVHTHIHTHMYTHTHNTYTHTHRVDELFLESLRSYLNSDVSTDVESMVTPAPQLTFFKELFNRDCKLLHK